MTREEFIEKYGNVMVTFSSYYKFTFNFVGTAEDGTPVSVSMGGDADEIYRETVVAGDEISVAVLEPFAGTAGEDSFDDY